MKKGNKSWWKTLSYKLTHREEGVYYSENGMDQKNVCKNCGFEFEGKFCPRCSQGANTKQFTFKNVIDNFLEVFDYNNRNVFKTVAELFYRPGYLIRDYISCRRASYYPPIKLLFFVCVFFAVIVNSGLIKEEKLTKEDYQLALEDNSDSSSNTDASNTKSERGEFNKSISDRVTDVAIWYMEWSKRNQAINTLLSILFLSLICRYIFRKAPKGKFNITEHFYALIYINTALIILTIIYILITREITYTSWGVLPIYISLAYYVITYKQLFGFNWFRTIIKVAVVHILNFIFLVIFALSLLIIFILISWKMEGGTLKDLEKQLNEESNKIEQIEESSEAKVSNESSESNVVSHNVFLKILIDEQTA